MEVKRKVFKNSIKQQGSIFDNLNIVIDNNIGKVFEGKNIEKEIEKIKNEIDEVLSQKWEMEDEINIFVFSDKGEYVEFLKNKFPEEPNLSRDNAVFHQNLETGEIYIANYTSMNEKERGFEDIRSNVLAGIVHEMTHLHPFFKKHGNKETNNLWEQELICSYIEGKVRGDMAEKLWEWGYISEDKIEEFKLEDGEWDNFPKEGKNVIVQFFYPFLVKEYGIDKTREIWKTLQDNFEIEKAIEGVLDMKADKIENIFKEKIKNKEYLKNIYQASEKTEGVKRALI